MSRRLGKSVEHQKKSTFDCDLNQTNQLPFEHVDDADDGHEEEDDDHDDKLWASLFLILFIGDSLGDNLRHVSILSLSLSSSLCVSLSLSLG